MDALPQKHDILWFPDGNIVLATDSFLFRVHKGVLSLHSTVMRDMFNFLSETSPNGMQSTTDDAVGGLLRQDLYEGLSKVVLHGDNGEDVAHLLLAIFQRGYYNRDDDTTPLSKIIALLTLSNKYDVTTIRSDVLMQLSRNYPTTLTEFELLDENADMFGRKRRECHIPLLKALSSPTQKDARIILPLLFYACACLNNKERTTDDARSLPLPILRTLLLGEDRLYNFVRFNISSLIEDASPSTGCPFNSGVNSCTMSRRSPHTPKMTLFLSRPTISKMNGDSVADVFYERRCAGCRTRFSNSLQDASSIVWHRIPSYFGLESWQAVRGTK